MSRNNTPLSPNAPLSFKTVPGRHRTQKWNKAPSYNYDGDEWGGYDPYDEYGGQDEPPPPPMPSQVPYGAPRGRKSSFDRGDDSRQFSAPAATSSFPAYDERRAGGPGSAASGGRGSNDFPRSTSRPRDFTNPEQVPPPLMTKGTPPPPTWFPPRKSSLSGNDVASKAQADEARAIAAEMSSPNTDKPLPFIRPSDIYKRIPDEIRRQSEEGGRPSMESLQRETSPQKLGLEPVQESRESRLFMDDEVPKVDPRSGNTVPERVGSPSTRSQLPSLQTAMAPPPARSNISKEPSPTLPDVSRISGFGDDFFQSGAKKPVDGSVEAIPTSSELARGTAPTVNTAGIAGSQTTFSSIQNTPTTTRAPPGSDPAGEILAERRHDASVDDITNQTASGLQHQPSQGFRSAVHQAFDRSDNTTPSRDSSQSGPGGSGVSRSDTNSTAGISPIMSRVPSAATAEFGRQQRVDEQVPPIAEEPSSATPTGSRPASGLQGQYRIPRKPSPGHSRNVSGEASAPSAFEPGYRRSLDPPSTGTSPARTPGMETTADRRLSTPMSAVPVTEAEAPDVADQAAEVPEPTLEPAETPASEISQVGELGGPAAVAKHTRGRSSTDYSVREADIADTVNSSPDKGAAVPAIAEAQRDSQKLFLDTHPGTPGSPARPGTGLSGSGTPTRADSPAKGRVREIADKYHEIHQNSRRNSATSIGSSKSSWSNFDAPRLKRQGTSQSQLGVESPVGDQSALSAARPELGREESFRPDLPGGWISTAPTPALESPPVQPQQTTPRQSTTTDEQVDLTPTTKRHQLPSVEPTSATSTNSSKNAFDAVKDVGDQLGAALLSNYGIGHQTRDFASSEPPAPVDQPETQPKPERGSIVMQPPLLRHETDSTDAPTSVASSVAPTPPVKDTPKQSNNLAVEDGGYFNTVAPLRLRSREPSPEQQAQLSPQRSNVMPSLSTDSAATDMDNDRLRNEIVRSLDPIKKNDGIAEDAERTQDALDAPDNERRVEHGEMPLPAAEVGQPRLLTTKFSWEKDDASPAPSAGPTPLKEPEPPSPEIKPEMAYERPRSKALHVMNPAENVESPIEPVPAVNEPSAAEQAMVQSLPVGSTAQPETMVSPITKSQEHLLPETNIQPASPSQSLRDIAPSPMSEQGEFNSRLPSYYLGTHDDEEEIPHPPEKDHTTASSMSPVSTVQAKPAAAIQPFRSILAMKSSDERIRTYNETRQTFADMNTGLHDWLSMMLEQHPEHANLSTSQSGFKPPALQASGSGFGTFRRGHKASPSIAKFATKFGGDDKQRSTSVGSAAESTEPTRPTTAGGDGPRIDMDKMQQRGKDFMKQAGVFGGKAQQGAKGLFAKGKSRFGGGSVRGKSGNEASPSPSTQSSASLVPTTTASAIVASPLATSTPAEESNTSLDAVREAPESPAEPSKPSSLPTDNASNLPEQNATTDDDPETPALSIHQPDPMTTAQPIEQTPPDPAPAAPPAEETPSTTAFISPSPALAPLSRSTSTSASAFRRPRSRTPSSTRTNSRPLSQVFDRLRSISRSSTRSGRDKGSSRSRPASMVLTNPDLLEDRNEDAGLQNVETADFALGDFSDVAVHPSSTRPEATRSTSTSSFSVMGIRSTERRVDSWEEPRPATSASNTPTRPGISRVMSMASPTRTEAWNEPDAQIPPKTPEERVGTPRRLGILPSPAPTAATFEEGRERRASGEGWRRRSSAVAWREGGEGMGREDSGEGAELETVPSEGERSEEVGDEGKERRGEDRQGEAEAEERPAPIRKGSDLAVLPSQRDISPPLEQGDDRPAPIRTNSDLAILPSQREDDVAISPSFDQGPSTTNAGTSPQRPQQRPRKFSDLELLPSQRRLSPLNIARPDSMTLTTLNFSSNESVEIEDEVHEASPVTIKPVSSPVALVSGRKPDEVVDENTPTARRMQQDEALESTPVAKKRADEELYESTPTATRTKEDVWKEGERKVSTASTSTHEQFEDARSEVSAEEGAQQASSHHSTNPTTSRHSSVSSLGAGARDVAVVEATAAEEPPVMSAQAVPAGPIGASPHTTPESTSIQPGVLQGLTAVAATRAPQQAQPEESGEYQQRFASRQYREQRPGMGERPMSYMPLPRDSQGLPMQETISTGKDEPPQQPAMPVDLSGMAGPPPGAPPFSQHPAMRNSGGVQPTQYERLRSSVISTGSGHTPHSSTDMSGRPPSGFFRGRPSMEHGAAPPPSRITDQHGLEGVMSYGQVAADSQPREEKQGRRRSGLWETLTSRRSSAQRLDSSRDSSVAPLENTVLPPTAADPESAIPDPIKMGDSPSSSKRRTLKKPQRASSSVVEAEPKKKRFSKLGSLFGRSSTTGGNASKPTNRLTKNVPPSRENSVAQSPASRPQQPQNSSTVVGSVRGYEAYEAARRRDLPAFQENAANVQPVQRPPSSAGNVDVEPPPGGWYGPQSQQQAPSNERPMSPTEAPRPEFRRLHSEGRRGERPLAQVPEAFRPTQVGFNRPVEPIGPPPGQEPPVLGPQEGRSRGPSYPGQTPSAMMERMMDPNQPRHPQQPVREPSYPDPQPPIREASYPGPPRHPSYGSEQYTPPISGRSEYYPPGSRPFGSLPSISPVQTRTAQEPIPEEQARSPAREYADQQTPWAITLPPGSGRNSRASSWGMGMPPPPPPGQEYGRSPPQEYGPPPGSGRHSRANSWGMGGPGPSPGPGYDGRRPSQEYGYAQPPPPPPQYRQFASPPPPQPQNRGMVLTDPANVGFYPPPPRGQPRRVEIPWEEEQPVRHGSGPYPPPGYASPPPQSQSYGPPPQQSYGYPQQYFAPPPQQRGPPRFYAQQQRQYSGEGRPMHQRRPSSGYSGRRDDMTVGEEELVMRGASYPGQEWAPPGLGRGGWE